MSNQEKMTRAEQIRKRRNAQRESRVTKSPKASPVASRSYPPVMMRGMTLDTVVPAKQKVKRRLDIPLQYPGAEVRLPSVPAVSVGWRFLSMLLTVILFGLLVYFFSSDAFAVDDFKLVGVKRIPYPEIALAVGVPHVNVFTIDPDELEQTLSNNYADIKEISVRVGFPATLVITIEEREPVIEWREKGNPFWIDEEGVDFPKRGEVEGLPVVVADDRPYTAGVVSNADNHKKQPFLSQQYINVVKELNEVKPVGSTLVYDQVYGFGWADQERKVYLGTDLADVALKLVVYNRVVDSLNERGIDPEIIDIEFLHAPFVRMEP